MASGSNHDVRSWSGNPADVVLDVFHPIGARCAVEDRKRDPDAIRDALQMSKKAFKRACGTLYKRRQIVLVDGGIRLVEG